MGELCEAGHHLFVWDTPVCQPPFTRAGEPPFTTDPRYAGRLGYLPHQHFVVDGVPVYGMFLRALTGPRGWVLRIRQRQDGTIMLETPEGKASGLVALAKELFLGHVEYRREGA